MGGFFYLNNTAQQKISNKTDAITTAHFAVERVSHDVRMASNLGDMYGQRVEILPATDPKSYVIKGSATFPGNNNVVYGPGGTPPPGFSGWPAPTGSVNWDSQGNLYKLSGQTLVVQVPIFDTDQAQIDPAADKPHGFPTEIKAGRLPGNPITNLPNLETHIYQVVLDPDQVKHPGEFNLVMAKLPGYGQPTDANTAYYNPANVRTSPQVLAKGIVGPTAPGTGPAGPGNPPILFQYLNKAGNGAVFNAPADDSIADFTGVIVNMELKKEDYSRSKPAYLALKQEIFLRNNASATPTGQPSSVSGVPQIQ